LGRLADIGTACLKEAALISLIDIALAAGASFVLPIGTIPALGLILLLESAALMLLGGALSFAGQPGVRKVLGFLVTESEHAGAARVEDVDARAAVYALTGGLLFVESMTLAVLTL